MRELPVGVMATGHQPFPAREDFLLVTTGAMRGVEIDADRAVARVGAGARRTPPQDGPRLPVPNGPGHRADRPSPGAGPPTMLVPAAGRRAGPHGRTEADP
ncbi:hypothetical protein [Streptomyces sp. NPDC059452]|uniref:hypothetical protein n=1 Tax=Streptomyces sp. NPDC059452 TaxID=3346835 RepID=UPI0036B6258A